MTLFLKNQEVDFTTFENIAELDSEELAKLQAIENELEENLD